MVWHCPSSRHEIPDQGRDFGRGFPGAGEVEEDFASMGTMTSIHPSG
jgi:hypothetical protein